MNIEQSPGIFINPGFAKAMTTMLQEAVFMKHPEINHIGKPFWDADLPEVQSFSAAEFVRRIVGSDSLSYDEPRVRKLYDESISKRLNPEKLNCISDESLTYAVNADRTLIAQRLHAFFPDAKILFSIRNQYSALYSLYKWRRNERYSTPSKFSEWLEARHHIVVNDRYEDHEFEMFDYYKVINAYIELFGRRNVCVLPMELLSESPAQYAAQLALFLDINEDQILRDLMVPPVNKRPPDGEIIFKRVIHRIKLAMGYSPMPPDIMGLPTFIGSGWIKAALRYFPVRQEKDGYEMPNDLLRLYALGNQKLVNDLKINVEKYGYPVDGTSSNE